MPNQKTISVKAARKRVHDKLRRAACRVVDTITILEATDKGSGLPANPYREILGAVEEYYNSLADEFDDPPGRQEPPLQSLEEACAKARDLNRAACDDPLAPLGGTAAISAARKDWHGLVRNAGPSADTAGDLLAGARDILGALENCAGIDNTDQETGRTYRDLLMQVHSMLGELETV